MSNGLKDKLENFIQTIKSKLPGKSDDEDYDDEENEEEFDEKTEEIDLKDKLGDDSEEDDSKEDDSEEDEDDEEEEDDEVAAAAKKKQTIIRGFIVLICLYLAYDTFMETPEEPVQAPVVKRKKRKKRKKKVKKVVEKKIDKVEVAPAPKPAPVPDKIVKPAEVIVQEVAPIVKEVPEPKVYEPIQLKKNDPVGEITPDEIVPKSLGEEISLGEMEQKNKKNENQLDKTLDKLSDNSPKMIENVEKKNLEYTEPPTYQETGKGLVYNCSGKHWACVDKTSYLNCKKNTDWSIQNKKTPECHTSNVYESFNDCRVIQVDKINTLANTSFCK